MIIPSKFIGERWRKLIFEIHTYRIQLDKEGWRESCKGIIFKGSVSVISSIATDGKAYTEFVEGTWTGAKFIAYLDRLLKYLKKISDVDKSKIGIIMDNCSVHRSNIVNNHFINN